MTFSILPRDWLKNVIAEDGNCLTMQAATTSGRRDKRNPILRQHHASLAKALSDDPQSPQQLVEIDGPADADTLGREQAVIVAVPHPFVPILPVPIDRHSHPSPLRNFVRVSLQIAHDDAPANALIAR
jgi:hypothetical protein